MTGVATAIVVGSAITADSNQDAAEAASEARPQFPTIIEPGLQRQLNRVSGTGRDVFRQNRTAGFTPFQTQAFDQTGQVVTNLDNQAAQAAGGFGMFTDPNSIGANPFLESAIQAMRESANRDFQRNQVPAIRNNAVAGGGLGGSRQGIAEGLAMSDLNQDLINRESTLRSNQVNVDTNNMLNALINQGQILSGQTRGTDLLQRTGALQQDQRQREIQGSMDRFNEEQDLQFQRDQELLRILMGAPASVQPIPNQSNPLVGGLGAGLTVSQLFPQTQPATTAATGTPGFNPASTNPQFIFG